MKQLYILLFSSAILLSSCTKQVLEPENLDPNQFMRTHERAQVAYVDYFTGNYILQTYRGYAVVESWGGYTPYEFDEVYGDFNLRGVRTIFNRSGQYFTQGYVRDNWLSWSQAMYLIDQMSFH